MANRYMGQKEVWSIRGVVNIRILEDLVLQNHVQIVQSKNLRDQ